MTSSLPESEHTITPEQIGFRLNDRTGFWIRGAHYACEAHTPEADPRWGQAVPLYYRNYRGRHDDAPRHLGSAYASPPPIHHPEPQWLLEVFDLGKLAGRSYALIDCDFAGAAEDGRVPPIAVKDTRGS